MECSIQLDIEGIFHIKNHVNILALAVYKHSLFAQAVGVHGLMLMPDTEHHQKYKTTQFGPKCGLFFSYWWLLYFFQENLKSQTWSKVYTIKENICL